MTRGSWKEYQEAPPLILLDWYSIPDPWVILASLKHLPPGPQKTTGFHYRNQLSLAFSLLGPCCCWSLDGCTVLPNSKRLSTRFAQTPIVSFHIRNGLPLTSFSNPFILDVRKESRLRAFNVFLVEEGPFLLVIASLLSFFLKEPLEAEGRPDRPTGRRCSLSFFWFSVSFSKPKEEKEKPKERNRKKPAHLAILSFLSMDSWSRPWRRKERDGRWLPSVGLVVAFKGRPVILS